MLYSNTQKPAQFDNQFIIQCAVQCSENCTAKIRPTKDPISAPPLQWLQMCTLYTVQYSTVAIVYITGFKCSSQSEIGQQLSWNHQFELILHRVFPKTNIFSSLVTKSIRIFFWRAFFHFCRVMELIHIQNRVFHTNILSNAAETLQLQSKITIFKNTCACSRENYKKIHGVCKKGHFLPFLAHCTLICQNMFFFKFTLIKSTQLKKNEIFP